ncbi:MAG: NTP/NDP exchange transporter [Holosporaceae bacterium]|jgi:AAA family ATP:ADP antiporter|nr:NTP/NDP exchange transporter [Holosporaceae bacterium]
MTTENIKVSEFSKWRSVFWPIHSHELKKFLLMAVMLMCILLNYSLLRVIKDALVVTNMGAETIPTLKLWFVFPSSLLFMIGYSKLSNILSKHSVFYVITLFFLLYFLLFSLVLYPFRQELSLGELHSSSQLLNRLLIPVCNWIYSSFYVLSELWGSVMITLLFWRFANDVITIKDSKRFYAMFGAIGNIALIISGEIFKTVKDIKSIGYLVSMLCVVVIFIYYCLNKFVVVDVDIKEKTKSKKKLDLKDSFKYILNSKYLGLILLLVICYGVSINLIEVTWKNQVKLLYPSEIEFSAFMGKVQGWTGVSAVISMLVGTNILRRCSWFTAAIITPVVMLVTGLMFFGAILFEDSVAPMLKLLGLVPLEFVVSIGLLQNVLTKGIKYSLYDTTKEMCYIPLDEELKSKGKAAVDVVGERFGKSGGAIIQFILLNIIFTSSSLDQLSFLIFSIFIGVVLIWKITVKKLNVEFLKFSSDS